MKKHFLNVLVQIALQLNVSFWYFWEKQQRNLSCSSALLISSIALNHSTDSTVMFNWQNGGKSQPEAKVETVSLEFHYIGGVAFSFPVGKRKLFLVYKRIPF